ncbi:MAG: NAD(P)-dependent oxidoreductase [Alphaproteobacteria bacterium]
MKSTIAFIGLGTMGRPMAQHLQKAGYSLRLWARRPETYETDLKPLIDDGAVGCSSPKEAATGADIVITMVTNTQDVANVLLDGDNPAVAGASAGVLCIDHSTIDPAGARAIAKRLKEKGIGFVDAPVSGGVWAAEDGTLAIMVGGEKEDLDIALPVVDTYAKAVTVIGGVGDGQVAKLCNQIAQVVTIEGVAEAMHFANANGADAGTVLSAISGGMSGSRMMDLMGPKMVARDFEAGIQARLHAKDLVIASEAAERAGTDLPAVRQTVAQLQRLLDRDWGRKDTASLLRVLEEE